MKTPLITYYANFQYDTSSGKIPKYTMTRSAGYYPPMEQLKGRNGRISVYLQESQRSGVTKASAPEMRLQARGSLNLTGLKHLYRDGQLSGYAYGYPPSEPTYSRDNKPNPFYQNAQDAFVFRVFCDDNALTAAQRLRPANFEMVVIEGAKILAPAYGKMVQLGNFDEVLDALRQQADNV